MMVRVPYSVDQPSVPGALTARFGTAKAKISHTSFSSLAVACYNNHPHSELSTLSLSSKLSIRCDQAYAGLARIFADDNRGAASERPIPGNPKEYIARIIRYSKKKGIEREKTPSSGGSDRSLRNSKKCDAGLLITPSPRKRILGRACLCSRSWSTFARSP